MSKTFAGEAEDEEIGGGQGVSRRNLGLGSVFIGYQSNKTGSVE